MLMNTSLVLGIQLLCTSGFATTHVVVSVRHPIINLPTPYQPRKYVEASYWREKNLTARVASIHAHYTRYFPSNGSTNPDVF